MPAKKKISSKKSTIKKTNPLIQTQTLQREIINSQNKLDKTYAKFLSQFKKQLGRFKTKIKQTRGKVSSATTSYKKTNIRTMITALEEKKKELTIQLDQVSREYKKFLAQQKAIQEFEKAYEKKLKDTSSKKKKKLTKKLSKNNSTPARQTVTDKGNSITETQK